MELPDASSAVLLDDTSRENTVNAAFLLVTTAWLAGAGDCCGGSAPVVSSCGSCCTSSCNSCCDTGCSAGLLERLRARFHQNDCCNTCNDCCNTCNDCCEKPGLLDRLRARFHNDCCDSCCDSCGSSCCGSTAAPAAAPAKEMPKGETPPAPAPEKTQLDDQPVGEAKVPF